MAVEEISKVARKPSALDFSLEDWQGWLQERGLPKYGATQLIQWIFQKRCRDPELCTNLSKKARAELADDFSWDLLEVDAHLKSKDGSEKFVLKTHDGLLMEMMLMPGRLLLAKRVILLLHCSMVSQGKL